MKRNDMNKDIAIWGVITSVSLVLLLLILNAEGFFDGNDEIIEQVLESSADELHPLAKDCLNHDTLEMHIHPKITIVINGSEIEIPGNIGISTAQCNGEQNMHVTHTHGNDGTIHVEMNEPGDVPLEVFFDVWGKHFNETGILDERVDAYHKIEMYVDGVKVNDFETHLLEDKQQILIEFGPIQGE
tara:strand:- start:148 stop:705 length:558 start_codon:yes stop_codon:yes gene_type:complete